MAPGATQPGDTVMKTRWNLMVGALCAALMLPAVAVAADEVIVYGIANFGGPGHCGSSSQPHTVHTSTAAAFKSSFDLRRALMLWDYTYTRNNSSARGTYFTDLSKN